MAAIFFPLITKVVLLKESLLNSVLYALDSVQYAKNIAWLLQCKVNENLCRYIIIYALIEEHKLQSNFSGSNSFGTMKISSRHG